MLPELSTADPRVKLGLPLNVKKTAVKTSEGTRTSAVLVLVRVTIRFGPEVSNFTSAAKFPDDPVNVTGVAFKSTANPNINIDTLSTNRNFFMTFTRSF